jgi:hypothetical protein
MTSAVPNFARSCRREHSGRRQQERRSVREVTARGDNGAAPPNMSRGGTTLATEIVAAPVPLSHLVELAEQMFGGLVKAVVDVERGVMAIGGELHSDEEALLISEGSSQAHLWGINLYPDRYGSPEVVEFDSMINIRPSAGNRSRGVEDPQVRGAIAAVVEGLVR